LAQQLGASGIGLVCKDGIILAAEKKSQSKLVEKMGFDKVVEVS
jgi:20S proteasome alpha/beta subunit